MKKKRNGHPRASGYPGERLPERARPELSIVIPAYNEAARLGPTLERIRDYVVAAGLRCQLTVIDDGSRDGTAQAIDKVDPGPLDLVLVQNPANYGKGYSVGMGMRAARGELVLMCDADLSAPIEELEKLRPWMEHGYDVVIGSRDLPESVLDPPQPRLRRWTAWVFRAIRRRLLLPQIRDTQCGFKLFRRDAALQIFGRQTINGWLFDCEILGLAERLGYRIKEVGVVWRNHPSSRVKAWREALTALPTLLAIVRRVGRARPG